MNKIKIGVILFEIEDLVIDLELFKLCLKISKLKEV